MQKGAFALIDCLGFKGIWNREDPELVIKKLRDIELLSETSMEVQYSWSNQLRNGLGLPEVKYEIRFLSDSVAISLKFQNSNIGTEEDAGSLVSEICTAAVSVIASFLNNPIPIPIRGCITYGEHLFEENFIIGPAVDNAAEFMDIAEGAFVWLHNSASIPYKKYKNEQRNLNDAAFSLNNFLTIEDYSMPIKNGSHLRCEVLNPLSNKSVSDIPDIIEKYSKFISGNKIDLWLKKQNTLDFLKVAKVKIEREFSKIDEQ